MNTTFSIKRIGYILRADCVEYKMYALLWSICCVAAWGLLLYGTTNAFVPLFYVVMLIMGINYCAFVGRKLHQPKGLFLTLPATTAEKFTALLIEGVVFLLAYNLLFWVGAGIGRLLTGLPLVAFGEVYGKLTTAVVSVGLFFFLLLLVFYVFFRKMALLWYVLSIVGVVSLITFACARIFIHMFKDTQNIRIDTDALFGPVYYLYHYGYAILPAASVCLLYLVYYKLKRKQLR